MKEELKNLTPEMVEELRKLGVEFEDTQMVWSCFKPTMELLDEYPLSTRRKYKEENTIFIPAPSLSEVLERLPKHIKRGDIYYNLCLGYSHYALESYIEYINLKVHSHPRLSLRTGDCLLRIAYELLCYVATNYPESIKGDVNKTTTYSYSEAKEAMQT